MKSLLTPDILREMLTEHGIPKEGADFIVSEFNYRSFGVEAHADVLLFSTKGLQVELRTNSYVVALVDQNRSSIAWYSPERGAAAHDQIKSQDLPRVMRFMAAFGITEF